MRKMLAKILVVLTAAMIILLAVVFAVIQNG
jgi:hypothetical protein